MWMTLKRIWCWLTNIAKIRDVMLSNGTGFICKSFNSCLTKHRRTVWKHYCVYCEWIRKGVDPDRVYDPNRRCDKCGRPLNGIRWISQLKRWLCESCRNEMYPSGVVSNGH